MAIAFDAVSSQDGGIAVSNTYNHTCASGAFLTTLGVFIQNPRPTGSATYAGAAMTSAIENTLVAFERDAIFYKLSPATGVNSVVTTASASARNFGGSISLTGVNSSTPTGATTTSSGTGTSVTANITTTSANSWIVWLLDVQADVTITDTGTNQTQRFNVLHSVGSLRAVGSTQSTTTTGVYTGSWTLSVSSGWSVTAVEILESAGGGAQTTVGLRIQEKLNILAGNSNYAKGMLTNAQCLEILNSRVGSGDSEQDGWNRYAGTTGLRIQDAANVKAGTTGLRVQDCVNLL